MATIEDLPQKSISEMTTDEALELLRQVRLSRRTPKASSQKHGKAKAAKAAKSKELPKVSAEQARKLLELLGGKQL